MIKRTDNTKTIQKVIKEKVYGFHGNDHIHCFDAEQGHEIKKEKGHKVKSVDKVRRLLKNAVQALHKTLLTKIWHYDLHEAGMCLQDFYWKYRHVLYGVKSKYDSVAFICQTK